MRRGTAERGHTRAPPHHENSPSHHMTDQGNAVEVLWEKDLRMDREAAARVQVKAVAVLQLELLLLVAPAVAEAGALTQQTIRLGPWEIGLLANELSCAALVRTL